ncbi:MAG TPA: histidinol-phosphate transaminase [Kofleriaceae bacterium]|nr:histidinol-phosphate transaminase [Kofleriaceae bacterium]
MSGGGVNDPFSVAGNIEQLAPYQAGKPVEELERELGITRAIKLASNENPLGPSPRALEAAARALEQAHLYPDAGHFAVKRALAERLGVAPAEIVVGGGSNELIHLLVRTFCRPGVDQVVTHRHAFISYAIAAQTHGCEVIETPVSGPDLRCDVDALVAAFGPRTRIVFVANPNNPTGASVARAELERVIEAAPAGALVVIDEAYHEYAAALDPAYASSQPYRRGRASLVTLRTFSKIYGLAGLRVGYGVCDARVAAQIDRVRRPFNVSGIAQAAAVAALDDAAHVERSCHAARAGMEALAAGLGAIGLRALPSLGNFALVDLGGREAGPIYQALLARGVIARPMGAWGLPRHLRISLGRDADNARLLDALRAAIA